MLADMGPTFIKKVFARFATDLLSVSTVPLLSAKTMGGEALDLSVFLPGIKDLSLVQNFLGDVAWLAMSLLTKSDLAEFVA